jgi:ATPase subunit of ABC transporter with duplicated ATPase domains
MAMEALRVPAPDLPVTTLSGGERRRVALCRELVSCPDLLILDEPTNHLDAATIEWLEVFIDKYPGTVVMVTHDRYFLDNVANYMVELDNAKLSIYEGNYSDYLAAKARLTAIRERTEAKRQKTLERELDWLNSTPAARTAKSKARIKNYERLLAEAPEAGQETVSLVIPRGPRLGNKVLRISGLRKGYGDRTLIDGLDLEVVPGQVIGVTGPNGVGKTTLFRVILGLEKPDAGTVEIGPTVKMTYVDQTREELNPEKTVYEEISEGYDVIKVGEREYHVREYLSGFQFKGSSQQTPIGKLSGGERNRLLLAKTLRRGANFLLLDEPTNDLDLPTLRVLEEALESFAGSAMIVSHDRFFLDRLANSLVIFEDEIPGKGAARPRPRVFNGNFEHYFEVHRAELAAAGVKEGKYRKTTYRKLRKQ